MERNLLLLLLGGRFVTLFGRCGDVNVDVEHKEFTGIFIQPESGAICGKPGKVFWAYEYFRTLSLDSA